jgi:hypothetical protein
VSYYDQNLEVVDAVGLTDLAVEAHGCWASVETDRLERAARAEMNDEKGQMAVDLSLEYGFAAKLRGASEGSCGEEHDLMLY